MSRIAGLPNSDSNRAFDMFLKIRYLQERGDGRGVVFATGTPISNTLAEMYTMLRYLGPRCSPSGRSITSMRGPQTLPRRDIAGASPGRIWVRMHTRFAKFINLPELLSVFRSVADVQRPTC